MLELGLLLGSEKRAHVPERSVHAERLECLPDCLDAVSFIIQVTLESSVKQPAPRMPSLNVQAISDGARCVDDFLRREWQRVPRSQTVNQTGVYVLSAGERDHDCALESAAGDDEASCRVSGSRPGFTCPARAPKHPHDHRCCRRARRSPTLLR